MSKLIVKSPYIKPGGKSGGYMKYIATRDGVEILPREGHLRYMATRSGADRHGLFSDRDNVDLASAMDEVAEHPGNIWTHIFSLRREDAGRLGYDSIENWRNLLKTHRNDIAAAMKISPQDFRWYAAFHNEGEHPHVHMMAWSAKKNDGYLTQKGIAEMRSKLTNTVFHQEMLHLYQQKTFSRDELVRQARKDIRKLARQIEIEPATKQHIGQLMLELSAKLGKLSGKNQYGYLPKGTKKLVDEIVDLLAAQPSVQACYDTWWQYKQKIDGYYSEAVSEQQPLSQQKEFKSIRNAVVKETVDLIGFEQAQAPIFQQQALPTLTSVAGLVSSLMKVFEDNTPQVPHKHSRQIDRKLLQKTREKRMAMGQAQDDHTLQY